MASGDPVVRVIRVQPPGTLFAPLARRVGGSTPAENTLVHEFDTTTQWYLDFLCRLLPNYAGGGLTFTLPWMAATATANQVRWGLAIRRIADDAEDLDTSHTYDYNEVSDTCADVSGEVSYPTIAFTSGVDMDSWAANELAVVRVTRVVGHGDDTMAGFAQLLDLYGRET